jgi:hypothetical protein
LRYRWIDGSALSSMNRGAHTAPLGLAEPSADSGVASASVRRPLHLSRGVGRLRSVLLVRRSVGNLILVFVNGSSVGAVSEREERSK